MSKNENRLNFRMTDETAAKIERWYQEDNCRSKNEFIEKAVNCYTAITRVLCLHHGLFSFQRSTKGFVENVPSPIIFFRAFLHPVFELTGKIF